MKLFKIVALLFVVLITVFLILWRPTMPIDLGSGYTYDYNPVWTDCVMIFAPGNACDIDADVVDYVYNKDYIVAEQKSIDTFEQLYSKYRYEVAIEKQMFDTFSFRQIWVIDKRTDSIYGPYQKAVYKRIKDSLGVPDTLKLQFERHR